MVLCVRPRSCARVRVLCAVVVAVCGPAPLTPNLLRMCMCACARVPCRCADGDSLARRLSLAWVQVLGAYSFFLESLDQVAEDVVNGTSVDVHVLMKVCPLALVSLPASLPASPPSLPHFLPPTSLPPVPDHSHPTRLESTTYGNHLLLFEQENQELQESLSHMRTKVLLLLLRLRVRVCVRLSPLSRALSRLLARSRSLTLSLALSRALSLSLSRSHALSLSPLLALSLARARSLSMCLSVCLCVCLCLDVVREL